MTVGTGSPSTPRPRRRWLRFSLRTLLLLVVLAAIFPGRALYKAERQRRAVAQVLSLGGEVHYEHQFDDRGWNPEGEPPGPAWLVRFFGIDLFARVKVVGLYGSNGQLTDDALKCLEALCDAEQLQIGSAKHLSPYISNDGLRVLRTFENLQRLDLIGLPGTTDQCLAHLARLQNLHSFEVGDVQWGSEGFIHLTTLPLEEVALNAWPATDEHLVYIGQIQSLKRLYLGRTQITDAGLAHLSKLYSLEELNIGNTPIGDEGIKHLFGLKKLRDVEAFKTNVTAASAAPLAVALPRCRIVTPFGAHATDSKGQMAWHMFDK